MKQDKLLGKLKDEILLRVFSKQLELITGHFQKHKTLDWDTCVNYLKQGLK